VTGRDQQILRAAEQLFAERSFAGVGVDEIGAAAGVTGSAIYPHFRSKQAILAALFDEAIDALLEGIGASLADPHDELWALVRSQVGFATSHQRLAGVWFREQRELAPEFRRSYQRRQRRYLDRWLACLADCFPGHTRPDLLTAMRGVQSLLFSHALRPPGGQRAPDAPELLTDLALAALARLAAPGDPSTTFPVTTASTFEVSN